MGATISTQSFVTLNTPRGSLRGIQLSDAQTGKPVYHRYTRIPYALPPVGPLRWQKSHHLPDDFSFNTNEDEPGDYTSFGPISPQPVYNHESARLYPPEAAPEPENLQGEDCLYLNVWVPAGRDRERPAAGWPVQFYIHGGWLQVGDAMQNNANEPFNLLLHTCHPRIIISPTYRLNIFGFLCAPSDPNFPSSCPGNFGFWDQRLALEWTHANISLFSGNPNNITVGGLSAGAHSAMFQLHYDTYSATRSSSKSSPLIRRLYLWSNVVGVQPNPPTSPAIHSQFNEVTTHFNIAPSLPTGEKLSILRTIPTHALVSAIPHLNLHTFRAVTDNEFIASDFLSSIYHRDPDPNTTKSTDFSSRLKSNGVKILLGEVKDEAQLYRLVNPPTSPSELQLQLSNYYPSRVVDALLNHYRLPPTPPPSTQPHATPTPSEKENYKSLFATTVATAQIHAPLRGLTHALLSPSSSSALTTTSVFRYRIAFRPRALDRYLQPALGLCHGADSVIWWMSALRMEGFDEADRGKVERFLEPFGRFLYGEGEGEGIGWGTEGEREVRELDADGLVRVVREEGEAWEQPMRLWECVLGAQV